MMCSDKKKADKQQQAKTVYLAWDLVWRANPGDEGAGLGAPRAAAEHLSQHHTRANDSRRGIQELLLESMGRYLDHSLLCMPTY
mmetsp:Transcript_103344/g.188743  ORF Transcript_103344/g.188743 Transcript_103344/m.188743 type:complete len:84 (+) Transcript_103344:170-421(+)